MEEDAMPALFPRRPSLTLVGAVALVIALANPAAAPPGDLDPTFDGDGKVTTDFAGTDDTAFAVAIQGDGKIVAAGSAVVSGTRDFALARYNIDGSLDPTFDGDGLVTRDFAAGTDQANAVAIQEDGKIVAAGTALVSGSIDFGLARYNTDGSLDPTFDTDGRVTRNFSGGIDEAFALAIQGDGKSVAAGFADDSYFALARYNTGGSLDPTFDTDGLVTTGFGGGGPNKAYAVAIQGDEKIVSAGFANDADFGLARYNTDGSLDPTFDGDGLVTTDFAGDFDRARAMAIQGDGKIVAAGWAVVSGADGLARYNTDGSLDPTFDGDGKVTTDFRIDGAQAVAIQGDGKIVTAGFTVVSGTIDFALARYNTGGFLDTTFSGDGKVTTDFGGDTDEARAVAIQGDGKIVAAGGADVSGTTDFTLARYNTDGSLDTTFSGDGKVTTDFGGDPDDWVLFLPSVGTTKMEKATLWLLAFLKATLLHMHIPRDPVGLLITVGFFLTGLLLGRLWLLFVPAIVWSLYFVIVIGWWGFALGGGWQSGLGVLAGGWQYGLIANILFGVATVAVGLFLRRLILRAAPWRRRVRS